MKKILMIVLVCVLSLSCLNGCKQDTEKTKKETAQNEETTFVKPKEYETVLTVTINPIFRLYLNSGNEVIAIEPVNKDAKSIVNDIDQKTKKLDEVIKNIVECADENNFLKKDATVDVKIVETTSAQDKQTEILVIVKDTVKDNFVGVNVNTSVDIEDSKKDKNNQLNKEEASDPKNNIEDKKQNQTAQSNTAEHKHQYAQETCTTPKKCSCGATEGKALGHKWADATCQAPKTCTVCKETTGNKGAHVYENSKCKFCKHELVPVLKTNHKYTTYNFFEDSANAITLTFTNQGVVTYMFNFYSTSDDEADDINNNVKHDGKTYYWIGGGGNVPYSYTVSKNEIVISQENTITKKLTILSDGTLKATYSDGNDFLVGSVFN